jgi:hypothetical protein
VRDELDTTAQRRPRQLGLSAFGLDLLTDLAPPGIWEAKPVTEPLVQLRLTTSAAIADSWSGFDSIGWDGVIDGATFVVERGRAGDHRFVHGTDSEIRAVHHLSPDAGMLQCAPDNSEDPSWWRVVLDSVLFTVALLHGYEALHAGAIATPEGAIAITASSGGGKSTLLSELMRHDLTLVADDVLVLESRGTRAPLAHPAAPLMTVPATRVPLLDQSGTPAPPPIPVSLNDERWIAVPVHTEPLPLSALVLLNRGRGLATSLHKVDTPLAALISSLLRFPRARERELARFELASDIAAHVAIWQLDADPSVAPDTLARLVMAELVERDGTPTRSLSTVS